MTIKDVVELATAATTPIVSFASMAVAVAALVLSRRTSKEALAISQRQVAIEQAKVRSDLFDRRYGAWLEMREFGERRYQAILSLRDEDDAHTIVSPEIADGFRNAWDKLYFLFGEDVNRAAKELDSRLIALLVARVGQRTASGTTALVAAQQNALDAHQRAYEALGALRLMVQTKMQVSI